MHNYIKGHNLHSLHQAEPGSPLSRSDSRPLRSPPYGGRASGRRPLLHSLGEGRLAPAAADEEATFDGADIDLDSILAKHGDAMRAALAAPDASAEDRDALAALRVPELKDRCRARGLRVGGTKAVLIDRLLGVEE